LYLQYTGTLIHFIFKSLGQRLTVNHPPKCIKSDKHYSKNFKNPFNILFLTIILHTNKSSFHS